MATKRISADIDREVSPMLQKAVDEAFAKFPKATRLSIQDGMGRVWIQIEDPTYTLHFHPDDQDRNLFDCHGYMGNHNSSYRTMRIPRLKKLADVMFEVGEFLDEFHAGFPEIEATR